MPIVKCVFPLFGRFFARARKLQKQVTPLTPLTPKSFAPYAPCAPFPSSTTILHFLHLSWHATLHIVTKTIHKIPRAIEEYHSKCHEPSPSHQNAQNAWWLFVSRPEGGFFVSFTAIFMSLGNVFTHRGAVRLNGGAV